MSRIRIEMDLEPADLAQLERRIAMGQFTDLSDAVRRAVRTAVHHWRYEETDESPIADKTAAAAAPRQSSKRRHFVVGDESDSLAALESMYPESAKALTDEELAEYSKICRPY